MNSNIDHMIEVLGWIRDNKPLQIDKGTGFYDISTPPYCVGFEFAAMKAVETGWVYRLKPTPVRRPFTEKEAQRLVGCVLVSPSPSDTRQVVRYIVHGKAIRHMNAEPSMADLADGKWHYHLPGHPDDLKPCWVEEVS